MYNRRAAAARRAVVEQLKADYRRSYALADDLTEADLGRHRPRRGCPAIDDAPNIIWTRMSFQFLAFGEDENGPRPCPLWPSAA